MNIWRMKLRGGSHGADMWPACKQRGIASTTHPAIFDTDLLAIEKTDLDPAVMTAGRSSIQRFAWDMKGGDVIFIGDSISRSIIAKGYITGDEGRRAYRYNSTDPITDPTNGIPWRHEVPVDWDDDFVPFHYIDGAPRITVMHFNPDWARQSDAWVSLNVEAKAAAEPMRETDTSNDDLLVNESAYMRETPASQRNILRLHASLSNRLRAWLKHSYGVHAVQERRHVDIQFVHRNVSHLAELKICYGENTKRAIREALGQILEYNYYPEQEERQSWWLVLDCKPAATDVRFIENLRQKYNLPFTLVWPDDEGFDLFPASPL